MSWEDLPAQFRTTAERVCTPAELEALRLQAKGYGRNRISKLLGISQSSVRNRIDNAYRKIRNTEDNAA